MIYKSYGIGGGTPNPQNPFSSVRTLLIGAALIAVLLYVIKGLVSFLYWAAPAFLILALIINHKIVLIYASDLIETFKRDVVRGIIGVVILVLGYPFVFAWLLIKGLLFNKVRKATQNFGQNLSQDFQNNSSDFFNNFNQSSKKQKNYEQRPNKNNDDEWAEYEEIK